VVIKDDHITDFLRRNARVQADNSAIVFEGKQISWRELWQAVEAAAPYFNQELGSQEQQVAAILLPNSIDCIIAYLSVIHAGHMALLLDPAYKKLEQEAIIEQLDAKLVITDDDYKHHIDGSGARIIFMGELASKPANPPEKLRLPAGKQIASLSFTSGATGAPKTVPNTHRNHLWNIEVCSKVWDWTSKDSLLVASPLSHMLGIVMGLSGAIYHGNTLYLQRWFDEHETLRALSSGKISFFSHAASAYVKLVQAPDRGYDLSGVRLCVSGAAPLPPAVWKEFKDRYGIEILETYGSSETGRIAGNRLDERVLGSPGKPLPGVDLRLSMDQEVLIKSDGVFPGYFKNSKATKANLTDDGYWRTGDIAEIKDGYIFLKARVQERIRRFGYTVSPRDVEWAMHQNPGVKDIYVAGQQVESQPDDKLVYFIVSDLSESEIMNYCKQNLLFAWRPDKIIHLAELPRTRSGKTRIGALMKMAEPAA
jgi:acyl-CoA synthetase (AMP-forming)/AMP-acid ligase II